MRAVELYALLQSSGYRLFLKADGLLGIRGPRPLPADVMAEVRQLKPELLELVAVSDAGVALHQECSAIGAISAKNPGAVTGRTECHAKPPHGNGDGLPPIPIGWTRAHWVDRLSYVADECEPQVPDRAEWLRRWAREVEQQR